MTSDVTSSDAYIRRLSEIHLDDIAQVGGKNASLGELSNALAGKTMVPETFAVTAMIKQTIAGAHPSGLKCGTCGQAPSDRPAFTDFTAEQYIDSISLRPDNVMGVLQRFSEKTVVRQNRREPARLREKE